MRAKLDLSDEKRIVIRELPFGSTTESLIACVEAAAKAGKIKIASISDFTTDKVEIEIKLQRGVYAEEVVDALYAFTECEQSISCNLLVIKDDLPVIMKASDVVKYHAAEAPRHPQARARARGGRAPGRYPRPHARAHLHRGARLQGDREA